MICNAADPWRFGGYPAEWSISAKLWAWRRRLTAPSPISSHHTKPARLPRSKRAQQRTPVRLDQVTAGRDVKIAMIEGLLSTRNPDPARSSGAAPDGGIASLYGTVSFRWRPFESAISLPRCQRTDGKAAVIVSTTCASAAGD